jgi:hypothetical protein
MVEAVGDKTAMIHMLAWPVPYEISCNRREGCECEVRNILCGAHHSILFGHCPFVKQVVQLFGDGCIFRLPVKRKGAS